MQVKLTIDRGNTALKAALWDNSGNMLLATKGDEMLSAGELAQSLLKELALPEDTLFDAAVYCTVVATDRAEDLDSLQPLCRKLIDLSAATPMPLSIDYATCGTLGADRIAAVLGAIAVAGSERPLLVSDIGTAVTYDFVRPGSVFVGGNIAPGVDLRLRALAAFTDALPAVESDGGDIPVWGYSTETAMRSGAVRGVAAELGFYHHQAGEGALAVLTGGSAELLIKQNLITFDYIYDPYLVHKGLYSIIKQ